MITDLWYKNAIVYCLSVESFMDANGDGHGDFEGLTRRLDYVEGLGITTLWLMPFQPSPRRDHGYDVVDYYNVDPRFGTLGDFVEFTHSAKQRGIRVLIDLAVNHTSDQHPWFRDARSNPQSPHRDWYVWADKRPDNAADGVIFPGVQRSTWTFDKEARRWYYHRFYDFQPDLNTTNPQVQAEILKIMGFWTQLGVSGFRLDAVPFLIARKDAERTRPKLEFDMLRAIRELLQWRQGDAILLGEANIAPKENLSYFGHAGERLHMLFNFHLNQATFYALAAADTRPLAKALDDTRVRPPACQWGIFLRNHDELDLGRLSAAKRQRVFEKFAPDKQMRLYRRGIRSRLAPMLRNDRRLLELAYSLMFTLPGTPVLRYGDEIGMGDDLSLPERNAIRTAMQWSAEPHGGFSAAPRPTVHVIDDGPYGYRKLNVAAQRRDPDSLLNWMERAIRMRKEVPEIGWGDYRVIEVDNPALLLLLYAWRNNSALFVHNFSDQPSEAVFKLPDENGRADMLINLLSEDHSHADDGRHHCVPLEPYGYRWFRVGALDEAIRRSEV